MKTISRQAGFSLVEAIAIAAIVVLLVYLALPRFYNPRVCSTRIKCVSNLKNIGLAARIYATDHNDQFPGSFFISNSVDLASVTTADYFRMLSNELSTPKILLCPKDENRPEAAQWTNMLSKNISYFASLTAQEHWPQTFLAGDRNLQINGKTLASGLVEFRKNSQIGWSKGFHDEQGNIAMGDGSVQQFSPARLRQALADSEVATNLVLIP